MSTRTELYLVTENPVSQARALEGMSLERLGNKLDVSKQYLSRAEHGTYAGLNRNLIRWISGVLEISGREVERQYKAFQTEKRRHCVETTGPERLKQNRSEFSIPKKGYETFRDWRRLYWESPFKFCVDMCVHPASVEKYEDGVCESMPDQLRNALREVDLLEIGWKD